MLRTSWLIGLKYRFLGQVPVKPRSGRGKPSDATQSIERLEDRTMLSYVTVGDRANFVLGQDSQVYEQKVQPDGTTGSYTLLAPGVVKSVEVGSDASGNPELFMIGSDDRVYYQRFDASANPIGGYTLVAQGRVRSIAVTKDGANRPQLFVQGLDDQVYSHKFDTSGNPTGGYFNAAVGQVESFTVGRNASGAPLLFAMGLDQNVYTARFDAVGTPTSGYGLVQAAQVLSIQAGHDGASNPELFVVGLDNQLYAHRLDGTGNPQGGYFLVSPGRVKSIVTTNDAVGKPLVYGIGFDDQVYETKLDTNGNPASGFALTTPGQVKLIRATQLSSLVPVVYAVGIDSQLYRQPFDANGNSLGPYTLTAPGKLQDGPVLSETGPVPLTYVAGSSAIPVSNTIRISDAGTTSLASAVAQITGNFVPGQDLLSTTGLVPPTLHVNFNAAAGIVTFTGPSNTSAEDFQTALRSITYINTSSTPTLSTRVVSFTVFDGTSASNSATQAINVALTSNPPVLAGIETAALGYAAGAPATAVTNSLTVTDTDSVNLTSATVQITGNFQTGQDVLATSGTLPGTMTVSAFDPTAGRLTLSGPATVAQYQAALRGVTYFNSSATPSTSPRTISFIVNDGSNGSNTVTRTVNVGVSPVLAAIEGTSLVYVENSAPAAITSTLTVADSDSPNLSGATVQITGNYQTGQDLLATVGTIPAAITVGTFDATSGTLALTGSATLADYQTALRAVTYANSSDNPNTTTRTVSFTVNDGVSSSNTVTRNLDVTAVNDPPVLANIEAAALAYSEASPATVITSTLTVGDPDNANLVGAVVQITGNFQTGEDLLATSGTLPASITAAPFDTATGTLTLTGTATLADYQSALRSITYANTSDVPQTTARTVSFTVDDGTVASNVATRTINVSEVNTAPVLANLEATPLAYAENAAATVLTTAITVTDADNANLAGATIQITGNFRTGEDVLAANGTVPAAITVGPFNTTTGALTLAGSATVADYQTALRAITYVNSSDNPDTGARTVSFSVNDGSSSSNIATRTINITASNDAPVLAAIEGAALAYTHSTPAVAVTSTLTVTDVDSPRLATATIQITGAYDNAADVLAVNLGTLPATITASAFNTVTGVLTLTGDASATPANFQTALRGITFQSTSASAGARVIQFTVNDGSLNSNLVSRTINVS